MSDKLSTGPSVVAGTNVNQPTTPRIAGVVNALVKDNQDPQQQGRVRVSVPSLGPDYVVWARLATTMAGDGRGTWFVPDIDDEVLVAFGHGRPEDPYVIGALWNGHDAPPHQMDADNDVKTIVSRRGIRITLDDTPGATSLTLSTPAGQSVTLSDANPGITLTDASQNSVQLGPGGITISTLAAVSIKALSLDIDAAIVSISAPAATFAGVVTADVVAAQVISGAMYSSGIGNMA
jgi:uncharacterized protein involved in type VI secretion and phage assembly